MPVKAFTIPITVPSSPTNGAVQPVVARMPRPRFSSAATMSISRSTARSTELMSAAVIVARSRSSGFTSESASPTTRATWLLFLEEAGEFRRELLRLLLGAKQLPPLLERAGPRDQRHQEQHDDDELRERAHRHKQIVEREAHVLEAPSGLERVRA